MSGVASGRSGRPLSPRRRAVCRSDTTTSGPHHGTPTRSFGLAISLPMATGRCESEAVWDGFGFAASSPVLQP